MNGKNTGIMLVVVGVLIFLAGAVVSFAATGVTIGGAVLGTALALVVAIPAVAGGVFLILRGHSEASQQVDAVRQRRILDMVKTRGQVDVSHLVIELNSTSEQIRNDIYKLVGMGVFTGYVNWDKGQLYSKEASQLKAGNTCPNCGGELALGGKGVVACKNCGVEVFL